MSRVLPPYPAARLRIGQDALIFNKISEDRKLSPR
jgi:hypothetical protein